MTATSPSGLSPHVRGNRWGGPSGPPRFGSIPARAGEPWTSTARRRSNGVYPRTCGGTNVRVTHTDDYAGLSPHVRGNRLVCLPLDEAHGSIPARAGEPPPLPFPVPPHWVYPRTCGGTVMSMPIHWRLRGLSPHVRGNRPGVHPAQHVQGSIPARAGEPPPPVPVPCP